MEKARLKIFFLSLFLSLPFWWGVNILEKNLEDFYLAKIMSQTPPPFFIAKISKNYSSFPPQNSQISAQSAILVEIFKDGKERVLFEKNSSQKMAIASLTKLMTALVALEFYQAELEIPISKKAVSQPEEIGALKVGEILKVRDLLYITLIESSNDAAFALSELIGQEGFVSLMNLKAQEIGMKNTYFFDPTGLDQEKGFFNFSTARDLVKLAKYILKKPLILEIISQKEYPLYLENGTFHHLLKNTNQLLGENPKIIGGKTGFTKKAGGCLILITKGKRKGSYLISVVLNSPSRFQDTRKLLGL